MNKHFLTDFVHFKSLTPKIIKKRMVSLRNTLDKNFSYFGVSLALFICLATNIFKNELETEVFEIFYVYIFVIFEIGFRQTGHFGSGTEVFLASLSNFWVHVKQVTA